MRTICRIGLLAAMLMLASVALVGCGGGSDQGVPGEPTTVQNEGTTTVSDSGAQVETEVSGLPAEFPADVPVHPGIVTAYDPMEVTESTTVHQLTVESAASFDDVLTWYKTQLPAGWSVGYEEASGENGSREGKIALTGGSYAPASADGLGGGVLIGVLEGETTRILTTVTVMAP